MSRNWVDSPPATWAEQDAYRIAMAVRGRRTELKCSAARLAEICTQKGVPMTRAVVADLESGRRRFVSTTELVSWAWALGISPFELLYAEGEEGGREAQILPSEWRTREEAQLWFSGMDDADMRLARERVERGLAKIRNAAIEILKATGDRTEGDDGG